MRGWASDWLSVFAWIGRAVIRLLVVAVLAIPIFVVVHVLWIFVALPLDLVTLGRVDVLKDALAYGLGLSLCLIAVGLRKAPHELGSWAEFRST